MALKKSELYSSLWSSCDELRGGMDASQYKDYVLVLLFIKYVSDKCGIPAADVDALAGYWAVCPRLRQTLVRPNRPGYLDLAVEKSAIKSVIYEHPEFAAFTADMNEHFAAWRDKSAASLKALQAGCQPKKVIGQLSESLLGHYADKPLIDPYDIYQHLMDYWAETMQDD